MEMKKMYYVVPVVVLLLLIGGYYGYVMMNTSSEGGGVVNGQVKEFTVVGTGNGFIPSTIVVNKGDIVMINLFSSYMPYRFTLSDYGISSYVTPMTTSIGDSVEFVASNSGIFTFYGSIPEYGTNNMIGQLIVNG